MDTAQDRTTRFAAQIVPAVFFFALVGLMFVDRPNWAVPPPPRVWTKLEVPDNQAFVASLDSPTHAQRGGYLMLYGWAAATSPNERVARVEIYIDGALAGATSDFVPSPDIAGSFGRDDFAMSGFQCVVPVHNLRTGQHQLQLRAVASDGKGAVVVTKNLSIVE